jgi:hypothetical protein
LALLRGFDGAWLFANFTQENAIHSIDPFNPENVTAPGLHRDVRQCFKSVRKHAVNAH